MSKFRNSAGQELVEFALILPLMLVILVAIAEMGFMWTLRGTVSDAVKQSVQHMQTIAGTDTTSAQAVLQSSIQNYLSTHGVPNASNLNVSLSDPAVSENVTVSVVYQYNPTFTLPNLFGIQLLPDTINIGSTQVINSAVLKSNNYSAGDTTFPASVIPTSPTSVLKDDPTAGQFMRKQMAFLVDLPGDVDRVVNWWGHDTMPQNVGINAQTGTVMVKSPYLGDGWTDTNESYAGLLINNGYTTVVYADGASGLNVENTPLAGPPNIYDGELGSSLSWCSPASAGGATCDGDLTSNAANSSLMVDSIYNVGKGYEVMTPVPSSSPIDSVTLPSGDLVADKTFRKIAYGDESAYTKLKFYYPKTEAGSFTVPSDNVLSETEFLRRTTDADGDGIPAQWDNAPLEADDDKNGIIDGYETNAATFQANAGKANYDVFDTGGLSTSIPTSGINTSGPILANGSFVSPTSGNFASETCAQSGCLDTSKPFFLQVITEYITPNGKKLRVSESGNGQSTNDLSEKYVPVDTNRKIYEVQILTRDFNGDGSVSIDSPSSIFDDDHNDDGKLDKNDAKLLSDGVGNPSTGLIFVDNNVAGESFNFTGVPNASATNGYTFVDPSSISSTVDLSSHDPSRKASTTP